jgi:multidrug efflux pump subunit AcrA (membrane-fusion protein)
MSSLNHSYPTEPIGDRRALDAMLAIATELGRARLVLSVHVFGSDQPFELAKKDDGSVYEALDSLTEVNIDVFERLSLTPAPGHHGLPSLVFHRTPAALTIQISGNPVTDPLRWVRATRERFPPVTAATIRQRFTVDQQQYLEQSELVVGKLRDTAREVLVQSVAAREALEKEFLDRRQALDTEHAARRQVLEAEIAAMRSALESDREALAERQRRVADREALHERRAKGERLRDDLLKRRTDTSLSAETNNTRRVVHAVCVVALLVLGAAFFGLLPLPLDGDSDVSVWAQQIRRVLVGGALGGVLWFYIRFTSDWFRRHSETEFRLRQFELDVDRANWLVEVTREWADAKVEPTPGLIDAISRGIFASAEERAEVPASPLSELARQMGRGEQLRLKIGENEVEVGRGALRAAGKGSAGTS